MEKELESLKDQLMKNVDFTRVFQIAIPILQPVIIGGLWLLISRFDKKADALSKLIAIAEPIPTVDLNIPKPVVLASLYHSTSELADVLGDILEFLQNVKVPSAEDIVETVKKELIEDPIVETVEEILPDDPVFKKQLADCIMNAKDTLGYAYWVAGPLWIQGCMLRKGITVSLKQLKGKL